MFEFFSLPLSKIRWGKSGFMEDRKIEIKSTPSLKSPQPKVLNVSSGPWQKLRHHSKKMSDQLETAPLQKGVCIRYKLLHSKLGLLKLQVLQNSWLLKLNLYKRVSISDTSCLILRLGLTKFFYADIVFSDCKKPIRLKRLISFPFLSKFELKMK